MRNNAISSNQQDPFSSLLPDLAGKAVREFSGIPYSGKYVRRFLKSQQRSVGNSQHGNSQEQWIALQHDTIMHEAISLVESVTIMKQSLKQPDSHPLTQKIRSAQTYSRVETRIRRTILALENIASHQLVYNKDIPTLASIEKGAGAIRDSLAKFPRLTLLRREIPEIEPPFREFLRRGLQTQFGDKWLAATKDKFPGAYEKWTGRAERQSGKDVLDGLQFDELCNILNAFPHGKECFKR